MSVILFTRGWLPSMHHRSHDRGGLYPWEGVCIQVGVCIQGWRTASRKVEGLHLGGGGLRKGGLHLGGGCLHPEGGGLPTGGLHPGGRPLPLELGKQTVYILLECFFVLLTSASYILFLVDSERLSSRTSFQLKDEVLDTSEP